MDPYRDWLQVREERRPPNHYELLNLQPFERDAQLIQKAYGEQMAKARRYQVGAHMDVAQRIVSELSEAFVCLTDTRRKEAYDAFLRGGETFDGQILRTVETAAPPRPPAQNQTPPPLPAPDSSQPAASVPVAERRTARAKRNQPPPVVIAFGLAGLICIPVVLWIASSSSKPPVVKETAPAPGPKLAPQPKVTQPPPENRDAKLATLLSGKPAPRGGAFLRSVADYLGRHGDRHAAGRHAQDRGRFSRPDRADAQGPGLSLRRPGGDHRHRGNERRSGYRVVHRWRGDSEGGCSGLADPGQGSPRAAACFSAPTCFAAASGQCSKDGDTRLAANARRHPTFSAATPPHLSAPPVAPKPVLPADWAEQLVQGEAGWKRLGKASNGSRHALAGEFAALEEGDPPVVRLQLGATTAAIRGPFTAEGLSFVRRLQAKDPVEFGIRVTDNKAGGGRLSLLWMARAGASESQRTAFQAPPSTTPTNALALQSEPADPFRGLESRQ